MSMEASSLGADAYKQGHLTQYPPGTTGVTKNGIFRDNRHGNVSGADSVVWFGLQACYVDFKYDFDRTFFDVDKETAIKIYSDRVSGMGLPIAPQQWGALHDLGYLPLEVWEVPEGTDLPIGVAAFVSWNTHPDFFWVTNFIETQLSAQLWGATTSATTAKAYRDMFRQYKYTGLTEEMIDYMGHDFSYRGMNTACAAIRSGMGHLLSFNGTDTIPAIGAAEYYYGGVANETLFAHSVPATEHAVMCAGSKEGEAETVGRLIEQYPDGILSVVSDTWDFFKNISEILPMFKDEILARDGTYVVRPDSGNPVDIICGDPNAPVDSLEHKGAYEILADIFGHTTNEQGFKALNPKIGLIYGDSITLLRQSEILERLVEKGFMPYVVLGIGSYTYNYVTRDTWGFAIKATSVTIDGVEAPIFKDPVTGGGMNKKSVVGIPLVTQDGDGVISMVDNATHDDVRNNSMMRLLFKDGNIYPEYWETISARVRD